MERDERLWAKESVDLLGTFYSLSPSHIFVVHKAFPSTTGLTVQKQRVSGSCINRQKQKIGLKWP